MAERGDARLLARRRFLQYLCASPLYAGLRPLQALADERDPARLPLPDELFQIIDSPEQALDVFDFQRAAQRALPPAHYGYLATGTDGNETLRANRKAFDRVCLRAMRMVDTSSVDTRRELLGTPLESPIVIAPAGSQRAFHEDGELATARAAKARDRLQILSNVSTHSIEDVIAARGAPVWFQLYPTQDFAVARSMIARAERAGADVLVLTVDLNAGSNRLPLSRYIRQDPRDCRQCHDLDRDGYWLDRKPMYFETGADANRFETPGMSWAYLERLREVTGMKLVIKGIVTAEDAATAVRHGVDAVYVSNHGGRAEASGWATLDSLPEVVAAVSGKVPVLVDSGFRRGSDIFKALALGADAVCVGRPYLWGLAAFGQAGVERVLEMLQAELVMVMGQMGATRLADIRPEHIGRHPAIP